MARLLVGAERTIGSSRRLLTAHSYYNGAKHVSYGTAVPLAPSGIPAQETRGCDHNPAPLDLRLSATTA